MYVYVIDYIFDFLTAVSEIMGINYSIIRYNSLK
jgi:hypothetical protein